MSRVLKYVLQLLLRSERRLDLVGGEVVDGVVPEGEAGAALGQQDLYPALVAGPRLPVVHQHNRDTGVVQFPGAGVTR